MPHVGTRCLVHEGCVVTIRFRQADLVRDIGIDTLVGSGLSCEGWVVLLHHLLLHTNVTLVLITLLIPDHLQVLDLSLRSRW